MAGTKSGLVSASEMREEMKVLAEKKKREEKEVSAICPKDFVSETSVGVRCQGRSTSVSGLKSPQKLKKVQEFPTVKLIKGLAIKRVFSPYFFVKSSIYKLVLGNLQLHQLHVLYSNPY